MVCSLTCSSNASCQWSRSPASGLARVQLVALPDLVREIGHARHLVERTAQKHRQWLAQDARGARVHRIDRALAVEHDHSGAQRIEDGLQARARAFELRHAAPDLLARIGKLFGHAREGARQAAELVARREHRLGFQVALGDLAHAIGQHHQRARDLVAQDRRHQHRAEHRQHERQRQRADVHATQAFLGDRAALVLAVGVLHRQRIGHQLRRHRAHHVQEALLACRDADLVARDRHQRAHAHRWACTAGGRLVVQPLELARRAGGARLAQQLRCRPRRRDRARLRARLRQHLAAGAEQHHVARIDLLAHALQRERPDRLARRLRQALRRQLGVGHQIGAQGLERAAAQRQTGIERAGHLRIEPGLDAARHELHGHGVDQHAGDHAHHRKDASELDQQLAAELAAAQPQPQACGCDRDHQQQRRRDHEVDPEQPDEVALEQVALAGQRQHEGDHQAGADQRQQRDREGPAQRFAHGVPVSGAPPRWPARRRARCA